MASIYTCKQCLAQTKRILEENNNDDGCVGQWICSCTTEEERNERNKKRYGVFPSIFPNAGNMEIQEVEDQLITGVYEKVNGFYMEWKVTIPHDMQTCEKYTLSTMLIAASQWIRRQIRKHVDRNNMPGLEKGRFEIEVNTISDMWIEHEAKYITDEMPIRAKCYCLSYLGRDVDFVAWDGAEEIHEQITNLKNEETRFCMLESFTVRGVFMTSNSYERRYFSSKVQ